MKTVDRIGVSIAMLAFCFWYLLISAGHIFSPTPDQIRGAAEMAAFCGGVVWLPLKLVTWIATGPAPAKPSQPVLQYPRPKD